MTSKSKNAVRSYETEIEKCREETNWKKSVELATQLKSRSPQHESLANFLIGEGKLEAHLLEFPPSQDNAERAERALSEARGYLSLATDEVGAKAGVALDAHLLLGKLHYACGRYEDALKSFETAKLDTLTEKELPIRSLRVVAESYSIKGLCMEEAAARARGERTARAQDEWHDELIRSYKLGAGLYLQLAQRAGRDPAAGSPAPLAGAARLPALLARRGGAIEWYREMATAVESSWTQALRFSVLRQLAALLLQAPSTYTPPGSQAGAGAGAGSGAGSGAGTGSSRRDDGDGPWRPKRYSAINQFVPQNIYEESFLSALLCEALAARDAVLSQAPQYGGARGASLARARAALALLAALAPRWAQCPVLREALERAMKFSFKCAHTWRQRALVALHLADGEAAEAAEGERKHATGKALAVSARARALCPDDVALRLLHAARAYAAAELEDGLAAAREALALAERDESEAERGEAERGEAERGEAGQDDEDRGDEMCARAHLYVGMGHLLMAQKSNARREKEASFAEAHRHLLRSARLDANDALAHCTLAEYYVARDQLAEAMDSTRECLRRAPVAAGGLRLAAALWPGAAALAADQHPRALWPLQYAPPQVALSLGRGLLERLRDAEDPDAPEHSSSRASAAEVSESAAAGGGAGAGAGQRADVWLTMADAYLRLGHVSAAAGCVAEAAALAPRSHLVYYTRGLVHEASGEWAEARDCFRDALALRPDHVDSLVHLGSALVSTSSRLLGEQCLAAAARRGARRDTWRRLARALPDPAAAAAAAALALPPA